MHTIFYLLRNKPLVYIKLLRGSLGDVSHPGTDATQEHGPTFRFRLDVKRDPEKRADGAQALNTSRRELA